MFVAISRDLLERINSELSKLRTMSPEHAAEKPVPGGWSPKEELGHLVDSAANNHQRFVRAVVRGEFRGDSYAQDEWVKLNGYQEMEWSRIIDLWYSYNTLLAHLIGRIPDSRSDAPVVIGGDTAKSLAFVVEDYIIHMQHHLDHLLDRDEITPYPQPELALPAQAKTL